MVESAVGKFDGEMFFVPCFLVDLCHTVEGIMMFVVIVCDVEAGAGGH